MPTKPFSKAYRLDNLLSENDLSASWVATDWRTGRQWFVKSPAHSDSVSEKTIKSILTKSFSLQKAIRTGKIHTATDKFSRDGELHIVYPYLDPHSWKPLTPEFFWDFFPSILLKAAVAVDYLHALDLVHCDLKLENFQINDSQQEPEIKLVDLDFLNTVGSSPGALLIGTPDHIAPEILANERISAQTDSYSLGISLKRYLDSLEDSASDNYAVPADDIQNLKTLVQRLTAKEPLHRPRFFINALHQYGIIDESSLQSAQKTLLSMILLTNFRRDIRHSAGDGQKLSTFLTSKFKMFGVHEELINDFSAAYRKSRLETFRVFAELIANSELNKYGDYWHVTLPDPLVERIYSLLAKIDRRANVFLQVKRSDREQLEKALTIGRGLKHKGSCLKAFMILRQALNQVDQPAAEDVELLIQSTLLELGDLATALDRINDAIRFYEMAEEMCSPEDEKTVELLEDLTRLNIATGRIEQAVACVEKGLHLSISSGNSKSHLDFKRLQAWLLAAGGNHGEAEEILRSLIDCALESSDNELLMKIYNELGTLFWRQGRFEKAKDYCLKSLEIVSVSERPHNAVTPSANLSGLFFDLSEYKKSIRHGKTALKSAAGASLRLKLPYVYRYLMSSYARLGEYRKAEYWLQRQLLGRSQKRDMFFFAEHYYLNGWIKSISGDFQDAKESFYQSLELFRGKERGRNAGKLHWCLAEVALYEWDASSFDRHIRRSRDIFKELGDETSLIEVDFLDQLNACYNEGGYPVSHLVPILERLIGGKSNYLATLCLFHILLHCDSDTCRSALHIAEPIQSLIDRAEAPLFRALANLIELLHSPTLDTNRRKRILKASYRTSREAGYLFLAILICRRIAGFYADNRKSKLAKKFLLQAKSLAEAVGNRKLIGDIVNQIDKQDTTYPDQARLLETIHGVSEILVGIDQYDDALHKVIQYAIDETGAERGVLLLKSADSGDLRVCASIDCDDVTLADVRDFSRTIPEAVLTEMKPLVVENALADSRTKRYRSVVLHNILSVICVPIILKQELAGILYLDHHTIPALFEKDDITFVASIANFVSVMITTIRKFRNVTKTSEQLSYELAQLGARQPLISQNRAMKQLLSKLPEIAHTNASVLFLGESGTGKEILAQMIHDLSLRSAGPLIKLNCAAIVGSLIESELFGVAKNTATGVAEREGKFAAADGGTLFLDEIGDMPVEVQAKVLRVLEYQEFERVGSNHTLSTDIRFIYASNKNLRKLIREEKFREDLFYRINTITIEIPPLRRRTDDIMLLVEHFMRLFAPVERNRLGFDANAVEALLSYSWPGNVRELRNLVEKCCISWPGQTLGIDNLPYEIVESRRKDPQSKQAAESLEKSNIKEHLAANNWNQSEVARLMSLPLSTLRYKIKKYRIARDF